MDDKRIGGGAEQVPHHCMGLALLEESNRRDGRQALEQGVQFNPCWCLEVEGGCTCAKPRGEQSF